jgi:hypothetical protein
MKPSSAAIISTTLIISATPTHGCCLGLKFNVCSQEITCLLQLHENFINILNGISGQRPKYMSKIHKESERAIHKGLLESALGIRVEPDEAILRLPKRGTPKMASLKPTA